MIYDPPSAIQLSGQTAPFTTRAMVPLQHDLQVEQIEFWGLKIPPGQSVSQTVLSNETEVEIIHVTNCALGENAKDGPNVVKLITDGREVVLGTLQKNLVYQFPVDFGLSKSVEFQNIGSTAVHLSGYRTKSVLLSETEFSDSEEEEDEEGVPRAIPLANGKVCPTAQQQAISSQCACLMTWQPAWTLDSDACNITHPWCSTGVIACSPSLVFAPAM